MSQFLLVPAFLIVLFLPGALAQAWLLPERADALEKIAEAAGASLALTALAGGALALLGVHLDAAGVILLTLAVLATAGGLAWRRRAGLRLTRSGLLAAAIVLLLAAWRLYQARDLVLPAWVDGVHHTLLVRLIGENGGLPLTWAPYLPANMYYHYGFHISAALFGFWARLEPAQAVLIFGQVLNAMVAVAVYRLGKATWGRVRPAAVAGLATAFAFHMPAYYVSWSRFPLPAGLVLMPLAMAAALDLRRDPHNRGAWGRLVLLTAGLACTHFLALAVLASFFVILGVGEAWRVGRAAVRARHWARWPVWQPFVAALAGVVLAGPWLVWVWTNTGKVISVTSGVALDDSAAAASSFEYLWYLVGPTRSHILLGLAGAGLLVCLWRRRSLWLAGWGALLAFLSTPYAPTFNPFRPDLVAILLFMPGSLLLAELLSGFAEGLAWLANRFDTPGAALAARAMAWLPLLFGLGLAGWGAWETRDITNPVAVLVNPADMQAIDWIKTNTPAEARFYVNGAVWMTGAYRGVDGGYWLLPLTGRFSVVLPAAYAWSDTEDAVRFSDWAKRASEITACGEDLQSLVRDAHLDYAYVRAGAGGLQPETLATCQGAERVYAAGGVEVFRLNDRYQP